MGLLTREEALKRIVCPRCHAAVHERATYFECATPDCAQDRSRRFPIIAGQPALVNWERSIVREEDLRRTAGASQVPRAGTRGPARLLRPLFSPANRVAGRHALRLRERLSRSGDRPTVLVVGGGTAGSGAGPLYEGDDLDVLAFDLYASPLTQFIADAHDVPLPDRSVQAVWVQAVLEHVLDPWRVVCEIERVLTEDGLVYAETPFLQQVHEGPYDFTRFTESGHRWLFRRFERLDSGVVAGVGTQLAWTLDHATRALVRSKRAGQVVRLATFWVPLIDRLASGRFSVDTASCVYFFGRRWSRELEPHEIVDHYRGAQAGNPAAPRTQRGS